jgi:hypothetical protein
MPDARIKFFCEKKGFGHEPGPDAYVSQFALQVTGQPGSRSVRSSWLIQPERKNHCGICATRNSPAALERL